MRVFVSGRDGIGWALDVQRRCLADSLSRLGHRITNNPVGADRIVTVHWTPIAKSLRYQFFRFKKTLVLATNFIALDDAEFTGRIPFQRVRPLASAWIVPSRRQIEIFTRHGIRSFYQPFYVEEVFFGRQRQHRRVLCEQLGIDYSKIEGRIVLGSIQRDTEGTDLRTPKWQKGPELLLDLVASLPDRTKFVLLLSSPRRHYVVERCRAEGIPYVFAGTEPKPGVDDVITNLLDADKVPLLYELTDIYLVTSKSEGGPKAVPEAALTRTFILSTDVGLAPDILDPRCVFSDLEEYGAALRAAVEGYGSENIRDLIERNYQRAFDILNPANMDALLQRALEGV